MHTQEWIEKLCPLPKRIEVTGCFDIRPDTLSLATFESDVWADRAAAEFADCVEKLAGVRPRTTVGLEGAEGFSICFLSPGANDLNGLFEHPFFGNFDYHPGYQPLPGGRGLALQGLDREGVYWGMKTLKQLILLEGGRLRLPRLLVADGADMEERGIWSQPFGSASPHTDREQSLAHYKQWLDWMSDHKLNLFEVMTVGEGGGVCFKSQVHPEFNHPDVENREHLLGELIPYGEQRGIRMIPIFSHPEHYGFIAKKFPRLVPAHAVSHHGAQIRIAVDFFQPKTRRVLQDLAGELLARFSPRGLCFWLSENRLHALVPEARRDRSEFLQEAETYCGIVQALRRQAPELECRILQTQGSFPENLALMRALPGDVKWIYYSGERYGTYNIREKNPIHRDLAAGAREGRWISLCNSLRGIPGRPTHLAAIYRNLENAVRAGFKGVDGMAYAFPGDKLALAVAAEQAWHCGGRTLPGILRAAAREARVADPDAQAQAYSLYDGANGAQALLNSQGVGQPFGNFSRFACMLERIRDNAPVDELIMMMADAMETDDRPQLAQAAADVEAALALSDPKTDTLFRMRCQYLLRVIRASQAIADAFYINCREKCWDLYKGPWDDYRKELRALIDKIGAEAGDGPALYRKLVRAEGWSTAAIAAADPLVRTAALAAEINVDNVRSSRD